MTPYPLLFTPVLKQTIWGGRRLGSKLNKSLGPESDYAESWEIVDHGDEQSVIENGSLKGKTLRQSILLEKSSILGESFQSDAFPLLLKYLDCNRDLSVQVHPDDDYAKQMQPPDLGKTESWYIVESDPGSLVYAGLKDGVTRKDLTEAVAAGETETMLHAFHPTAGDILFIPAGTVHALGAGLLVAEIQQSSDTTFRLFDWNRVGGDGKGRPLHIQQSLDVTDFQRGPIAAKRAQPNLPRWQEVVHSDKFTLQVLNSGSGQIGGDNRFHILTVPKGFAVLQTEEEEYTLTTGQSLLLPAAMPTCTIEAGHDSVVLGMHEPVNPKVAN